MLQLLLVSGMALCAPEAVAQSGMIFPNASGNLGTHPSTVTSITQHPVTCVVSPTPTGGTSRCAHLTVTITDPPPPSGDAGVRLQPSGASPGLTYSLWWAMRRCDGGSWTTYTTTARVNWSIIQPGDECREIQIGGTVGVSAPPGGGFSVLVELLFQNTVVDTYESLSSVAIQTPVTCQVNASSSAIDFGDAVANTSGGVTLSSQAGTRSYSGQQFDPTGSSFALGEVAVLSNAPSVQVTVSPPAVLNLGSDSLPYALNWSQRDTPGGSWFPVSGTTTTASPGGDDFVGFRFGGTLSVGTSDDAGPYSNTMAVSVTCN